MAQRELKAVIDRIEEGKWAVLLVGQEQTERIVPVEQLPEDAMEGSWLRLQLDEETIRGIVVDAEETSALRSRMASKLDQLRSRQRHFKPQGTQRLQQRAPATPNIPDKGDKATETHQTELTEAEPLGAERKEAELKEAEKSKKQASGKGKAKGKAKAKETGPETDEVTGEVTGEVRSDEADEATGTSRWKPFAQNEDFYDWEGYE